MEGDTDKCFILLCRTWPRHESNWKSLWGNYIYLLDFSYDIRWCKVKLLHFFDTFGFFLCSGGWHAQVFYTPCRIWPRDESNGKSFWGNYIYLLEFSYDIRWCKVKLLHFFDTFGIISLQWRVKRTTLLYPRVGHGPGMNRTEKVYEVTTFISSIFRMIFGDVRSNCYTFLTHLDFFSAVEDNTHKSFIPPCRTWPRGWTERKKFLR